jgi:hypothetical protein
MATAATVVLQHVQDLIREGEAVLATESVTTGLAPARYVELGSFATWLGGCSTLHHMLGAGNPWAKTLGELHETPCYSANARRIQGTLKAIEKAVQHGHIVRVEDLARADVLGDLLEQAEHLREKSYHLAAGVLCRASLEEHLRAWCIRVGCAPLKPDGTPKDKPTIEDFKQELKKANHIDGITSKHIDHMAAIGNACAHNKAFTAADVDQLVNDLRRFMAQNAIPAPTATP